MSNARGSRAPLIAGMLYLLLPFAIFIAGWLKWYYAALALAALTAAFLFALRDMPALYWPETWDRRTIAKIAAAFLIICAITVLAGVGGHVYQTYDQYYRNEIFRAMVKYPWPVVRDGSALVYYFAFWMPAALVGKLMGLSAGFDFQIVWTVLGLVIFFFLLCAWRKKIVLWPLLLFLFFSGLDILGALYIHTYIPALDTTKKLMELGYSLDFCNPYLVLPSMINNLFWSHQQAAPISVLAMLLLLQPNCRNYAFLGAVGMLFGTLAVVGLVPVALALALSKPAGDDPVDRRWIHGKAAWTAALRDVLSPQNIIGGGCALLLMLLFLGVNRSGAKLGVYWAVTADPMFYFFWLISFIYEIGIYYLLIAKMQEHNCLLPVLIIETTLSMILQVGYSFDLCLRVSMATLTFLALLVMDTLAKAKREKKRLLFAALILTLCAGALTPLSEIYRTVINTSWGQKHEIIFVGEDHIFTEPNFNGAASGNVFFDVLAKPQKE